MIEWMWNFYSAACAGYKVFLVFEHNDYRSDDEIAM